MELDGAPASRRQTKPETPFSQRLLPKALKLLEAKIEANDQDSWRAAVKLIEYGWGRPREEAARAAPSLVAPSTHPSVSGRSPPLYPKWNARASPSFVKPWTRQRRFPRNSSNHQTAPSLNPPPVSA